jgi:uncharacterized protein
MGSPVLISFSETSDSIIFNVRVIPRSSRSEIAGELDGALKIKLKSPPVGGAANEELIQVLSKIFGVSRANVELVSGAASRTKRVRVAGITKEEITAILQAKI